MKNKITLIAMICLSYWILFGIIYVNPLNKTMYWLVFLLISGFILYGDILIGDYVCLYEVKKQ